MNPPDSKLKAIGRICFICFICFIFLYFIFFFTEVSQVASCRPRFLRHSQIFEQLFVLINTKEVFWNIQALKYR